MPHCRTAAWNLCHPVNIYVYKNGVSSDAPTLVHIPGDKKRNIRTVLEIINERIKFPAGFAVKLYTINGLRVCRSWQLEMYQEYVAVSNMEKGFRCAEYGKVRDPIVVAGSCSKHIRSICLNDRNYNILNVRRRQSENRRTKFGYAYSFVRDGLRPEEITAALHHGQPECGILCRKVKGCCNPSIDKCPPPSAVPSKQQFCEERIAYLTPPPAPKVSVSNCSYSHLNQLCRPPDPDGFYAAYRQDCVSHISESPSCATQDRAVSPIPNSDYGGSGMDNQCMMAFYSRYRNIGTEIYKKFNDRLNDNSGNVANLESEGEHDSLGGYLCDLFQKRLGSEEDCRITASSNTSKQSSSAKFISPQVEFASESMLLKEVQSQLGVEINELIEIGQSQTNIPSEANLDRVESNAVASVTGSGLGCKPNVAKSFCQTLAEAESSLFQGLGTEDSKSQSQKSDSNSSHSHRSPQYATFHAEVNFDLDDENANPRSSPFLKRSEKEEEADSENDNFKSKPTSNTTWLTNLVTSSIRKVNPGEESFTSLKNRVEAYFRGKSDLLKFSEDEDEEDEEDVWKHQHILNEKGEWSMDTKDEERPTATVSLPFSVHSENSGVRVDNKHCRDLDLTNPAPLTPSTASENNARTPSGRQQKILIPTYDNDGNFIKYI